MEGLSYIMLSSTNKELSHLIARADIKLYLESPKDTGKKSGVGHRMAYLPFPK